MATLTEEEFSRHLNTKFDLALGQEQLQLELVQVKAYLPQVNEQSGMERFSAYFEGSAERYLPQQMYHLTHKEMGGFDLFLVPIEKHDNVYRYEAVFNYFKNSNEG